ncbi:MAG TPA: ferredoxin [Elusimicrobia bacterium]|nr:MAG: hypothetical protein A2278_01330 [Elusimicrobia bacterium RIFOXYA12_FULL_49_49]OGS09905.1 MAG: hypothetical protein A2204_07120 [Elusimicrobia bacterium RIFOXYA1_FULL_47_7]OGS10010.1 MAG: hypothetical protein A2386_05915 [Elusimicrobia bacterium RIFOXYB1_FULL_48_9]OGS15480.1 MAG: hypothetical protein A2251_03065 [Elusimicrobia bacterium RIFOXYA2_FULL_47_53]OGS26975.1 MAG: hypothetical protein A2339_04580 [Elusimicrobia bacterium RIFOXYB12_FULL_50_12]OGS30920.1 MAG: hypothetical protein
MKVSVDSAVCIGCGLCASSCPDVFEMDGLIAVVLAGDISPENEKCAAQMVKDCPVNAIKAG